MFRKLLLLSTVVLFLLPAQAARADDPASAAMLARIAYVGDPGHLITTFSLVSQRGGETLWSSRNVDRSQSGGVITINATLRDGDWSPSRDVRWCLKVDARRAVGPVRIDAVRQVTPRRTYGSSVPSTDFSGDTKRICIRGAVHDGYE